MVITELMQFSELMNNSLKGVLSRQPPPRRNPLNFYLLSFYLHTHTLSLSPSVFISYTRRHARAHAHTHTPFPKKDRWRMNNLISFNGRECMFNWQFRALNSLLIDVLDTALHTLDWSLAAETSRRSLPSLFPNNTDGSQTERPFSREAQVSTFQKQAKTNNLKRKKTI